MRKNIIEYFDIKNKNIVHNTIKQLAVAIYSKLIANGL